LGSRIRERPSATDFSGRRVNRNEQGKATKNGWTVDHILPLAANGPDKLENQQITHYKTNEEKADKTSFEANGRRYQVKRMKNLSENDTIANYPYEDNDKKYGIVFMED
jgi:CRISPR/Cas system Type II protein with McrA/HNH and RuvC-like nuclease domain